MAGMRKVAEVANVALSTVSAVLNNNNKRVSEETRQKVLQAVRETGYKLPAKKKPHKKTIAVILPVITSSFFSNILNGIEEVVSQDTNMLLFYNSNYNFEKEEACIKSLRKQELAGVIIDSICAPDMEQEYFAWLENEFVSKNIPVVLLERRIAPDSFFTIYVENFDLAYHATEYLIKLGHKKIAHISGNERMMHSFERLDGYKSALLQNGLKVDNELIYSGDFSPLSGFVAARKLLELRSDFTALFAANDQMAIGAIKALKMYGKNTPEDCAVVGFDNLSVSTLVDPALTTINVPIYQMGRMAARLILDTLDGKPRKKKNQLEANLIVRRSSDITAMNEWDLTGW